MQNNDMNKSYNMATDKKLLRTFGGDVMEDISVWIRDAMLLAEVFEWSERDTVKMLIGALKDDALSWASQVLSGSINVITLESLVSQLKKRFGDQKKTELTLSRFLSSAHPRTREEFSGLLRDATAIFEKKMMSNETLAQMIVTKSPSEIKALLYQTALSVSSWDAFVQKAEEVSWIAFPDKMLTRVEENRKSNPNMNRPFKKRMKKFCVLHGEGSHSTRECKRLDEMLELERKDINSKKKNVYEVEIDREPGAENKNSFIYSHFSKNSNPFFIYGAVKGNSIKILLDTGADISLIPKSKVENIWKIEQYYGSIKSVCGNTLRTEGIVKDMELEINGLQIIVSAVVTENERDFMILGADVIKSNPALIFRILDPQEKLKSRCRHRHGEIYYTSIEENCDKKYKLLFKTEISEFDLCTAGKHSINTGVHKPIYQRNARIPIYHEKLIDEEIKKNLTLGIIRPSKSPWNSRIVPIVKKDVL
ncbi:MAG: retroviral-like aspartic protease family protein [Aeromonas sp.]